MINKFIILLALIFFSKISLAQQQNRDALNKTVYGLQISYQNGYVFPTNDFVKGINAERDTINLFQTFSLKFLKQSLGSELWEQLFNYPEYGLGIYIANFYNPEEMGFPIVLYSYFKAPFYRWNKFSINYEIGLGIAFNWKNYSPANVYNIAIGAKQSAYIDLGLSFQYQLSKKLFADLGFSFTHFSNGRLKAPNYGLNTVAPKVSLKYNLANDNIDFKKQKIPEFISKNEIYLSSFIGIKNILYDHLNIVASEKFEGESFYVFGILSVFNRQISYKSKLGFGFGLSYDGSTDAQVAVDAGKLEVTPGSFHDNLQISIYPSYELVINRVSIIIQPSFYLYRKKLKNQSPVFYQRIGLKYNFYKNLYAGLNLRSYQFHISDFIEWNIGYKIGIK